MGTRRPPVRKPASGRLEIDSLPRRGAPAVGCSGAVFFVAGLVGITLVVEMLCFEQFEHSADQDCANNFNN